MIEADIFKALADPTRRKVFEKLAGGSLNANDLRHKLPAMEFNLNLAIGRPCFASQLRVGVLESFSPDFERARFVEVR